MNQSVDEFIYNKRDLYKYYGLNLAHGYVERRMVKV